MKLQGETVAITGLMVAIVGLLAFVFLRPHTPDTALFDALNNFSEKCAGPMAASLTVGDQQTFTLRCPEMKRLVWRKPE